MALSQTTTGDEFSNDLPISNLGDLIILLAMSRIGGEPTPKEVSAFLRRFYIDLDNDYIRGRKKAAEHLYGMEAGVLRKPDKKTIKQVRFLLRALRALERPDKQELPAVMVRKDSRIYDVCVWSQDGFRSRLANDEEYHRDKEERRQLSACTTPVPWDKPWLEGASGKSEKDKRGKPAGTRGDQSTFPFSD